MQLGNLVDKLIGTKFLHLGEVSHPYTVVQSVDEEQPIYLSIGLIVHSKLWSNMRIPTS